MRERSEGTICNEHGISHTHTNFVHVHTQEQHAAANLTCAPELAEITASKEDGRKCCLP